MFTVAKPLVLVPPEAAATLCRIDLYVVGSKQIFTVKIQDVVPPKGARCSRSADHAPLDMVDAEGGARCSMFTVAEPLALVPRRRRVRPYAT